MNFLERLKCELRVSLMCFCDEFVEDLTVAIAGWLCSCTTRAFESIVTH